VDDIFLRAPLDHKLYQEDTDKEGTDNDIVQVEVVDYSGQCDDHTSDGV
jgi:hypothetical protein